MIDMYDRTTLVIFKTVEVIIDILVGHTWDNNYIYMCIYTIELLLVIFKTVVSAMDIFFGHTWDISNWSLLAILVIRFFCWSNLCLVTDDCRHDWGTMIQGFSLKGTTVHLVMTVISALVLDYLQRIFWFFMGRLLELCSNFRTLVLWRVYWFYSPAIFLKTGPAENLPIIYGEIFRKYAIILEHWSFGESIDSIALLYS